MITIIGAGLAGLSAALRLAEKGIECALVSAQPSERAQSVLAEGGINAALDLMGEGDAPAEHCADTLRGGCGLASPSAVAGLTERAPELVRWLRSLGVPFQMERGAMIQRNFGGQKKKRTAFAKSSTGKALMTALIDEARRSEVSGLIHRFPHHELTGLRLEGGRCAGAGVRDTYTGGEYLFPGPVILASGGLNGLFPGMTTGTTQNTGDASALAFAAGAELGNLEFIQYHPTTVQITGKRLLVSEAARGEGGRLYVERDGKPWYFMEELHPELGNLSPRDVVSRESARVLSMPGCGGQVYLDLTGLPGAAWEKKLPDMREEILHYLAIDPAETPVPVSPGIHFFMGGLLVDGCHRTSISGLYAAGECACIYHGANRLGGNSTLAALYGGERAAESAAAEDGGGGGPVGLGPAGEEENVSPAFSGELTKILLSGLGILRSGEDITRALERLGALEAENAAGARRAALGRAMLLSALARRESRGAHTRTDFPKRDDENFQKTTVAHYAGGEISVAFREIPK